MSDGSVSDGSGSDGSGSERSVSERSVSDGLYVVASNSSESGSRFTRFSPSSGEHRIVFVHGAMDRSTSFSKVRALLSPLTTVAYDRRGYSRSVGLGPAVSFRDHVDDLLSVIDGQRSVLVGHSYGGNVCLAAAGEFPDLVSAMVVFEAPMSWEDWWPSNAGGSTIAVGDAQGPEAAAESFMRRIVGDAIWEGLSESTKAARRNEGRALLFDLAGLRGRGRPYDPSKVVCPTVIGHGQLSLPHQIRSSVELHELLIPSSAEVLLTPSSSSMEVHPLLAASSADALGAAISAKAPSVLRPVPGARHGAHSSDPVGFCALVREAVSLAHAT